VIGIPLETALSRTCESPTKVRFLPSGGRRQVFAGALQRTDPAEWAAYFGGDLCRGPRTARRGLPADQVLGGHPLEHHGRRRPVRHTLRDRHKRPRPKAIILGETQLACL
jgi:hypothetical protein